MGRELRHLGTRVPELYVYNIKSKIFYLKAGHAARAGMMTNPSEWCEARQVVADAARGPILPGPPAPEIKPLGVHVGPPLPPRELSPEEKLARQYAAEDAERREEMSQLIREELRSNRRAQDMEADELADLLSRKLRAQVSRSAPVAIPRAATLSRPRPQAARPTTSSRSANHTRRYVVREPDQYEDEEYEEEDES